MRERKRGSMLIVCALASLSCHATVAAPPEPRSTRTARATQTAHDDPDGDRVIGSQDRCPTRAEDRDGVADEDGCPEVDQDCDGVADERDGAPVLAEDVDRFEDEDGVPDPDNDHDRIVDWCDRCPDQPEVFNGRDDEDGCPDRGEVVHGPLQISILQRVFFAPDRATIDARSSSQLSAIANALVSTPEIRRLAIVGHADRRERRPTERSQQRADAVMLALTRANVAPNRLVAYAAAAQHPADP